MSLYSLASSVSLWMHWFLLTHFPCLLRRNQNNCIIERVLRLMQILMHARFWMWCLSESVSSVKAITRQFTCHKRWLILHKCLLNKREKNCQSFQEIFISFLVRNGVFYYLQFCTNQWDEKESKVQSTSFKW